MAWRCAISSFCSTASEFEVGGLVFGISNTVVTPPTAAACVALVQVSLWEKPGSRKCTCTSMAPGRTWRPLASMRSLAGGIASAGPMAAILPPSTAIEFATIRSGSTSMPPEMTRSACFIRAHGAKLGQFAGDPEQVVVALSQAPGHRLHLAQQRVDVEGHDLAVFNQDTAVDHHGVDARAGLGKHELVDHVVDRNPPRRVEPVHHKIRGKARRDRAELVLAHGARAAAPSPCSARRRS